jgi:hypothetical protein
MRIRLQALLVGTAILIGCSSHRAAELSQADTAEIEQSARVFAGSVARDVTNEGPAAWRRCFADLPAFFMAFDGQLQFRDSAAATAAIQNLSRSVKQIDLKWGDDLRVDVLAPHIAMLGTSWRETIVQTDGGRVDSRGYFTGPAERRGERWQFRNAHWSTERAGK